MLEIQYSNGAQLEIKRTSITRLKHHYSYNIYPSSCLSWNQKNLDYEIETGNGRMCRWLLRFLEIKRTSITRLKPDDDDFPGRTCRGLKSKEPRLRDWNELEGGRVGLCLQAWNHLKSKEPRLRDWNNRRRVPSHRKNCLEIKRTSITRLKPSRAVRARSRSYTWNQKNLDYEIETIRQDSAICTRLNLKSKEPRLRDWNCSCLFRQSLYRIETWNQKNLDYEIETVRCEFTEAVLWPWNQKNLDYEIETRDAYVFVGILH